MNGSHRRNKILAGILVILMVTGIVLPVVTSVIPYYSINGKNSDSNVQSLVETGLSESKAKIVADALEEKGCGTLSSIQVDDEGDGYLLTMYDETKGHYAVQLDYYGNLLTIEKHEVK